MKRLKEIAMYVLGALVVIGFFFILWVVFNSALPENNNEVGLIVIGALVAKFGDVVNYFFGSSKGSADKTEIMSRQNQK